MTAPKLTEAAVLELLRNRHHNPGNGGSGEWAFMEQVSVGGRRVDAVAMHLWHSRGFALHAFEVKVSRSDWLRELKDAAKADVVCQHADHFTVVAPAGCVKDGELPDGWGFIAVTGDGVGKPWRLREVAKPAKLHRGQTRDRALARALVVGMMRAVPGAVPGGRSAGPLDEAEKRGREAGWAAAMAQRDLTDQQRRQVTDWRGERLREGAKELQDALVEAGVSPYDAEPQALVAHAEVIAEALRAGRASDTVDDLRRMLSNALKTLDGAA